MSAGSRSSRATRAPGSRANAWVSAASLIAVLGFAAAANAQEASSGAATQSAIADTSRPVMFLKETVITGARYPRAYYESPQALSFVSRAQLRDQGIATIGDVFATMPGMDNSKDSPWEQRPVLRGLGGQRVLVLVDGMPMNSARGNGPHPSLVDPAQVERIEVVRGPSSVAYGSDALGGVINIITREAIDTGRPLAGSTTVGASSADGQGTGYLELMPRVGKLSAFLSSGGRNASNFHAPHQEIQNSDFNDYNALANLRYDFTEKTWLKLGWQLYRGGDIGIPGLSVYQPDAIQEFDFAFYNRDYAHLTLDHGYRSSWLAGTQLKVFWQQEHRDFFSNQDVLQSAFTDPQFGLPPQGVPGGIPPSAKRAITTQDRYLDLSTRGFQAQLTSVKTRWIRFTAGLDAARDHTNGDNVRFRTYYDSTGAAVAPTSQRVTASVPDGNFDNYGGYLQSEWFLHPRWTLSAGGRYTRYRYRTDYGLNAPASGPGPPSYFQPYSLDDDAVSGSGGIVYSPVGDLHLSFNVANGYREPNAQDLYFSGPASVGTVLGNQSLKPEKSVSYDMGLRWGPGTLGLSGNLFYSTYNDLIDAVLVPPPPGPPTGPPTYQYVNITEARIWGYEGEVEWRFLPRWSARGTVAAAIGDITNSEAIQSLYGVQKDQAPLGSVPPLRGSGSLRWSDRSGRYWVEPGTRWSWRTSRLPLPTPGVPEFTEFKKEWIVGDLFGGARLPWGQKLVLGVRNFTNTPYRQALASLDDPGINLVGQLTTDF
jgi:hemoglobin/transferrin/lactoferrin receptor protein